MQSGISVARYTTLCLNQHLKPGKGRHDDWDGCNDWDGHDDWDRHDDWGRRDDWFFWVVIEGIFLEFCHLLEYGFKC